MSRLGSILRLYVLPIAASALATAASWIFSDGVPVPLYIFFLGAVLVSAYFGQWRSGVIATAACAFASLFFLVPPRFTLEVSDGHNLARLVAFVLMSLTGTALIQRLHFLLQRERLYNAIISTTPALTVLTDSDGRILLFNRHCEELTGYSQAEVLGKSIPDLFLPTEWNEQVRGRFATLDAAALRQPHENPWRTKDGQVRMIEWRCVVMPQETRPKPFVLGIGLDVTEIRDARQRLRELDRISAQWQLASVIAHELHNPMQALSNVFALLQGAKVADEQWYEYLQMADAQLKRMSQVSQRLTALGSTKHTVA